MSDHTMVHVSCDRQNSNPAAPKTHQHRGVEVMAAEVALKLSDSPDGPQGRT